MCFKENDSEIYRSQILINIPSCRWSDGLEIIKLFQARCAEDNLQANNWTMSILC